MRKMKYFLFPASLFLLACGIFLSLAGSKEAAVKVKQDMVIQVPEEVFGIKKYEAKVVRNWNVASFIKEFVVEIPEEMDYKAGYKKPLF